MKVMIIGATGLLGKPLMRQWTGDELMGTGSRDLDIRDAARVRELVEKNQSRLDHRFGRVHGRGWLREASRFGVCGESGWRGQRRQRCQVGSRKTAVSQFGLCIRRH